MSGIQGWRVRFPHKRQAAGLGTLGLVLSAGLLTGYSVFRDYSGDTCDGRKPVESLEQAGKGLVAAAYAAGRDGVCRVTHAFHDVVLDEAMVAKARELLAARGITPQNVTVVVGEQMGSGVFVDLTDGSNNKAHAIRVDGISVRGDGYTIFLPQEVYPEVPEDAASPSASTGTSP
ncbi:hypothetical protein [Paeniglutamicibacter kerguelensis]|uniref:Uncharacterized protein n=1 Tax=Paeniglutamicibacter kerguelensis TaxID=254788 RepID=A0ABS4X847_9MICC|nr:hypothetical protein [Paeniglutamicibacter kerguelensis]MBP2384650.1 hypothetical protein [Paeniglutamicibacter kerguelensis]